MNARTHSLTHSHTHTCSLQINEEQYNQLVKDHIMFKDMSVDTYLHTAGIARDWPFGRGCYVSGDREFIIWVGEEDHLRIMCMQKGTILNNVFDRSVRLCHYSFVSSIFTHDLISILNHPSSFNAFNHMLRYPCQTHLCL